MKNNLILLLFEAITLVCFGDTVNGKSFKLLHSFSILIKLISLTPTAYFTCQEEGVFPNPDTNDCKTYVICDANLNNRGVFDCIGDTYFWPDGKGCFSQYNCAMETMPDNINPCEGFSNSVRLPDKDSSDCSKYLSCSSVSIFIYGNGQSVKVPQVGVEQCPSGTFFRPGYGCINSHQCVDYQCTTEGLFENPNDCSTFIKCWKNDIYGDNGLVTIFYPDLNNCPPNTKFNPHSQKCDTFYNCDGIDPHGGIDPCSNYNHAHPFVPNPYDNDASSYIECQYNFNFIGTKDVIWQKECPADTFFSPLLGKCYNNYDATETCSKDPCSSGPGKYVNYESGHCKSYIECRDDTTTPEVYKPTYEIRYCPPGTRYSPGTSDCSRQYICPTFPVNYCYPQIPTTTTAPIPSGSGGNN